MSRISTRIAVAYALFVLGIIVAAGVGGTQETFGFITRLPYGDKLGHFGLMGLLALVADKAAQERNFTLWGRCVPRAPAAVAVLVCLEELSQLWLQGRRTFDKFDLLADALGIVVFVALGRTVGVVGRPEIEQPRARHSGPGQ